MDVSGKISVPLYILLSLLVFQLQGQSVWNTLAKVRYEQKRSTDGRYEIDVPVFHQDIKNMDGKLITLSGFLIPLEEIGAQKGWVLSSVPYNACFYCGGAGPETVVELAPLKPLRYTAAKVTIQGILQLNHGDPDRLMYQLRRAVLITE